MEAKEEIVAWMRELIEKVNFSEKREDGFYKWSFRVLSGRLRIANLGSIDYLDFFPYNPDVQQRIVLTRQREGGGCETYFYISMVDEEGYTDMYEALHEKIEIEEERRRKEKAEKEILRFIEEFKRS